MIQKNDGLQMGHLSPHFLLGGLEKATLSIEMNVLIGDASGLIAGRDIYCALVDGVDRFSSELKENYSRLGILESIEINTVAGTAELAVSGVEINAGDWLVASAHD